MTKVTTQKDKIGQDLAPGDIVAVPNSKTDLKLGRVIKLTPKGAKIDVKKYSTGTVESFKPVNAIIKINPEDALLMVLSGEFN
jgi:hypothetical protein